MKCAILWSLPKLRSGGLIHCETTTVTPQGVFKTLASPCLLLPPAPLQGQEATHLFVSIRLSFLGILYKQNPTPCILLGLTPFTYHVFEVALWASRCPVFIWMLLIICIDWMLFNYMYRLHFVCPFIGGGGFHWLSWMMLWTCMYMSLRGRGFSFFLSRFLGVELMSLILALTV